MALAAGVEHVGINTIGRADPLIVVRERGVFDDRKIAARGSEHVGVALSTKCHLAVAGGDVHTDVHDDVLHHRSIDNHRHLEWRDRERGPILNSGRAQAGALPRHARRVGQFVEVVLEELREIVPLHRSPDVFLHRVDSKVDGHVRLKVSLNVAEAGPCADLNRVDLQVVDLQHPCQCQPEPLDAPCAVIDSVRPSERIACRIEHLHLFRVREEARRPRGPSQRDIAGGSIAAGLDIGNARLLARRHVYVEHRCTGLDPPAVVSQEE